MASNVSGGGGQSNPCSPKQGGKDKGPDHLSWNLKREGRIGRVPQASLKLVQLEWNCFARVQAEVNTKKLEVGTDLVSTSHGLSTPRTPRQGGDQMALAATARQQSQRSRCGPAPVWPRLRSGPAQ